MAGGSGSKSKLEMMVGNLYWKAYILAEHSIPKLDMEDEYIDRHKPRKKTNRTNYQHYRWDCLNSVLDLLLIEFNDRFGETNSNLLTYMAAFSPKDSFADFKLESLIELAKLYPDDFNSDELKDLAHDLPIYMDNIKADERFSGLSTITELAKLIVDTKKHLTFPLVYRLLKLVLVLPVATTSVERCFSAMKIVKILSRNRMGNKFMNDRIICFVEPAFLATIPDKVKIDHFQKMENRNRKMLL